MKINKVLGSVLFLVLASSALWFSRGCFMQCEKSFRAQSSFVLCDSSVTTNADGRITLSQCRGATGTYQDLALIVSDGLKPLLRGGSRSEAILHSYLQSKSRLNASARSVANAFESAEYRMGEASTGSVNLFVTAESKELAIAVNSCILSNYVKSVEAANLLAEGKALAQLKWDIQKRQEAHEDASDLLCQLEHAKGVVKKYHKKIIVTSSPHIIEKDPQ